MKKILFYILFLILIIEGNIALAQVFSINPVVNIVVHSNDTSCDRENPNGVAEAFVGFLDKDGNFVEWYSGGYLLEWFDADLNLIGTGKVLNNASAGQKFVRFSSFGCSKVLSIEIAGPRYPFNFTSCTADTVFFDFTNEGATFLIDSVSLNGGMGSFFEDGIFGYYLPDDSEFLNGNVELNIDIYHSGGFDTSGGGSCYPFSDNLVIELTKFPITISNNTVAAARPPGTLIGHLKTNSCTIPDNAQYEIIAVNGAPNNQFATIDDRLYSSASFSNSDGPFFIDIRTQNIADSIRTIIRINITPDSLNVKPYDFLFSNKVIPFDPEIGSTVGLFTIFDQDYNDTHTIRILKMNGIPFPLGPFVIEGAAIKVGSNLVSPPTQYDFVIEVIDQAGGSLIKGLTVSVNRDPSDLLLSKEFIIDLEEPLTAEIDGEVKNIGCINLVNGAIFVGFFTTIDAELGRFQYSLVEGFGSDDNDDFVVSGSELFSIPFDLTQETSNIKKVRVRTEDQFGGSFEKAFNIEIKDVTIPTINQINTPEEFLDGSPFIIANVTAGDNYKLSKMEFYFRGIASEDDYNISEFVESSGQFNIIVSDDIIDDFGLEFFFRVVDEAENYIQSDTLFLYRKFGVNNSPIIPDLMSDGTISTYEMISIPYQLSDPRVSQLFESELGAADKKKWRLLHYKNETSLTIEFPGDLDTLEVGKGYWFNSKLDVSKIEIGEAVIPKYNRLNQFKLSIKEGWNQIGNPYHKELDWNYVRSYLKNSSIPTIEELIVFESGGYKEAANLNPFRGAWLHSDFETEIVIPHPVELPPGGRVNTMSHINLSANLDSINWFLGINISNSSISNELSGIGMHEEALDGKDYMDRVNVPRFIKYLDISFDQSDSSLEGFRIDFVSATEYYQWDFTLETNFEDNYSTISWVNEEFINSNKALLLFDRDEQQLIDMSLVTSYNINMSGTNKFKIYYGDKQSITELITPEKITLGYPYPNPLASNNSLKIPFTLTRKGVEYGVKIFLLDAKGKIVQDILNEKLGAGFHEVIWNAETNNLNYLPKGIYIINLFVESSGYSKAINKRLIIR